LSSPEDINGSPRKDLSHDKDWTKGPVTRNLLSLSWPMVIMEGIWVVSQLLDMIWVGKLGPDSIAGIGIANTFLALVYSVDMGVIVGVRVIVRVCVMVGVKVIVGVRVRVFVGPTMQPGNCTLVVPKTPVVPALVGAT